MLAAVSGFLATRRSLKQGLCVAVTIGYFYGIIRANVPQPLSHFIFDAAAGAVYVAVWLRGVDGIQRLRAKRIKHWVAALAGWPMLLFFLPGQALLIRLVGLRGAVWFLPFLLIGAVLSATDLYALSQWLAVMNVVALGFAGAEYFRGIEPFYPPSAVTELIYTQSFEVRNITAWRIPAVFANQAAYSATMNLTLPLLLGGVAIRARKSGRRWILIAGIGAAALGVFLGGSRSQAIIFFSLVSFFATLSGAKWKRLFGLAMAMAGVGLVVARTPGLQRFTTLDDTGFVRQRIAGSVNLGFVNTAIDVPLGNGLGGGGSSIPYFLRGEVKAPLALENEYGSIMIDQGIPGLCLWIAFVLWALVRFSNDTTDDWQVGRKLAWFMCAISFGTAFIGSGLLTSIPGSCLLFLLMGWMTSPRVVARRVEAGASATSARFSPLERVYAR